MKKFLPIVAVVGLFASPALADFAAGPATPADPPAAPQLDACKKFCNFPAGSGNNLADGGTIRSHCPADSIAAGGDVVYELVEGLDKQ